MNLFLSFIIVICFLCVLSALIDFAKKYPGLFLTIIMGIIVFVMIYLRFKGA